jgi:tripartite-type tricarboxylate transporter receptor subunit TctC
MNRRLFSALLFGLGTLVAGGAFAQARTVRLVVAFPPGGPVDIVARAISEQLGRELDARVIVENKAGANGGIAAEYVARSAADGTTLWLSSVGAVAINPALYEKLVYDPVKDFVPVSLVVNNVEVLVVPPGAAVNSASELVAASRAKKDPTPIASTGVGSIPHLALELFADASRANLQHIPYKGAAPAITDVMGGQVAGFFGDVPGLIGHIKGGKVKAIGIAADKRHPLLPDVKTLPEQGINGVDSDNWYGLFAPAKTPPDVLAALNAAVRRTVAAPAVRDRLVSTGADPVSSSSQELAALLKRDTDKWARVIKAKNIKDQ